MDPAIQERLNAHIKKKGLRNTPQRNVIVEEIFSKDEHFTADELWERVRKTNSGASRATVYRTISLLVEARLLHEIDLGEEVKTYDPNFLDRPAHNHLICVDCGKVLEFEDTHVGLLNDCLSKRMGYTPVAQAIRIEASCDQLRIKKSCPNLIKARVEGKRLPRQR